MLSKKHFYITNNLLIEYKLKYLATVTTTVDSIDSSCQNSTSEYVFTITVTYLTTVLYHQNIIPN